MPKIDFVHLHNHTEYSLLDGAIRLNELIEHTIDKGMSATAITDHGNMFGVVPFYLKCVENGIKPIIGSEMYVAPKSRLEKTGPIKAGEEPFFHLILLVENAEGYKNLIKLSTEGYLKGFYYKPRIDKEFLSQHSKGLIALSGCLRGEIASHILRNEIDKAEQCAREYREIMGQDNFFLELQDHGLKEEKRVNSELVRMSQHLNIPLVATNDCHYITQEDSFPHDVLICIQTGKTVQDKDRLKFANDQYYFKSPEEMGMLFAEQPEALRNTVEIARRCHLLLDTSTYHLPRYDVPEESTSDQYFEKIAREGFEKRLERLKELDAKGRLKVPLSEYKKRLDEEILMVKQTGFSSYFLIVWDFIDYARREGIPVGPGRGSGAGSLVAYCMNITDIDPLQYGLLFERFLNPERVSSPDFDIDFCMRQRGKVIDYVTNRYGRENVSQIITFGTMAARAVIRDTGRGLNIPYSKVDSIAKMIPYEPDSSIDKAVKEVPQLAEMEKKDEEVKTLLSVARRLEGLTRHASTHAAGVVIASAPLTEYVPLYKGGKNEITTQYAMGELEKIGLLKMDFLGLRTLTVIKETIDNIRETTGKEIELDLLPLDDSKTYRLFSEGRTTGIFQFESSGMKDILRRFNPQKFDDLIALNALYRPGPIRSGMIDEFIRRKHGKIATTYEVPELEEILGETHGVIVYQEQVMQIASQLAGFTMGEADILRRAMGKKKREEMRAQKEKFLKGAKEKNIPVKTAQKIYDLMQHFAGYGFNKSHSTAYALLAYQTAYLKTHYPLQFMAALLTSEMENTDKLAGHIAECREMGIKVFPPDINESQPDFTAVEEGIRFGLAAIKNVGLSAIDSILEARQKLGVFTSFVRFCEEVDLRLVNKRVIESLVKSGAFDSLGLRRSQLFAIVDRAIEHAQRRHKEREKGQISMFATFQLQEGTLLDNQLIPDMEEWSERKLLAYEKDALGFYITGHPLTRFESELKEFSSSTTADINQNMDSQTTSIGGVISRIRRLKTKSGELMAIVRLEDLVGSIEITVFPKTFQAFQASLKADEAVLVKGKVEADEDKAKLLASEIIPLREIRQRSAKRMVITIPLAMLEEETVQELHRLLEENRGECSVKFELVQPQKFQLSIKPNAYIKVNPTKQLIDRLEEMFGKGAVTLVTR
ncbi:MAG: DNA polymerase III subunit alpha [Candidatus Aminicenantes bacterium]|nr:DNA polymerase III subunit alpha [Candidatus Aminicenantes bacterium]